MGGEEREEEREREEREREEREREEREGDLVTDIVNFTCNKSAPSVCKQQIFPQPESSSSCSHLQNFQLLLGCFLRAHEFSLLLLQLCLHFLHPSRLQ